MATLPRMADRTDASRVPAAAPAVGASPESNGAGAEAAWRLPPLTVVDGVTYPDHDPVPMAETGIHVQQLIYLLVSLESHFLADPLVYAAADMLVYYEQGNPRRRVAPDVFVVKGVPKHQRRVYLPWREGVLPRWCSRSRPA